MAARRELVLAVMGYMACSSTMLVVNKKAVHAIGAPATVLMLQMLASAGAVKGLGMAAVVPVDALERKKAAKYFVASLGFLLALYANMKTLQHCNVETFIVFRASTPLVICIVDWRYLGRMLPSAWSSGCLLCLLVGAVSYVWNDHDFVLSGYCWVGVWYVVFCFDQCYIKHIVDTVSFTSNWGRVYYMNLLAAPPLLLIAILDAEIDLLLLESMASFEAMGWLLLSCGLGLGMSYFSFLSRAMVSATYFTVIGNMCKLLSVVINILLWDKHASSHGLASLLVCLAAAYMYEQAPPRVADEQATGPKPQKVKDK